MLDVVLTAMVVSAVVSFLLSLTAYSIRTVSPGSFWILFLAVFGFSILGFVTGELLGDSRESVVGSIVPAVLTLLGAIVAYIISSKGVRAQTAVSASLICFTFCFLLGSLFGIQLRIEYEDALRDPQYLGAMDLRLQQNKAALEIERLQDYVTWLQLRNDYAKEENLNLSQFQSEYEKRPSDDKKPSDAASGEKPPPNTPNGTTK